jgi:hypothetical protein
MVGLRLRWGPSILQGSHREEKCMKKYMKPSLTALGLLRVVTKFSTPQYSVPPRD